MEHPATDRDKIPGKHSRLSLYYRKKATGGGIYFARSLDTAASIGINMRFGPRVGAY